MNWFKFPTSFLFLLVASVGLSLAAAPSSVWADDAPPTEKTEATDDETIEGDETKEGDEKEDDEAAAPSLETSTSYTINTLIMFLAAVLVLFMQAGFAMLEVGLNAAKNTINILFKNVMDISLGVILFLVLGFGLMYPGEEYAGKYFGYNGPFLEFSDKEAIQGDYSGSADFIFQVAFAATAATIVSGAVAGRMKFGAYLIYSAVLTGLIYPISGMWKWGGGFLAEAGFQDFAGSVVVHAVGGFAGLAGAIVLGARIGRFSKDGKSIPMPGHNIAFAALGVFILWVGWYGFNPGSQLTYFGATNANYTVDIAMTTTIAAAAGGLVATALSWALFKKPDITMALNGVLAGLVGITANCDRVEPTGAIIIGAIAGALVIGGIMMLDKLRIDDPVGAWPVHGLCGVWGGIATGLLGAIPTNDAGADIFSRGQFIWVQCYSTAIICVWAFVTMFGVFYALKLCGILRVSPEEEQAGLDISEHGMHAYPPQLVVDTTPGVSLPPTLSPGIGGATKPSTENA